jgi:hypothetical protein
LRAYCIYYIATNNIKYKKRVCKLEKQDERL